MLVQKEAHELRHSHIGSEHLLLGLLREQQGLAAQLLESFDVIELVLTEVVRRVGPGEGVPESAAGGKRAPRELARARRSSLRPAS